MSAPPPFILVIDDEDEVRDMLAFSLEQSGFRVMAVASGAEGIELVHANPFDLVITDLKMPVMDGVATTRALRVLAPALPVVLMSGFVPADGVAACLACGANAFIRKPFGLEEIEALVRRTLREAV